MTHVVVDAAGGDHGLEPNVRGALDALQSWPEAEISLVGPMEGMRAALAAHGGIPERCHLVDAPEQVLMTDPATAALRQKRRSSIRVGLDLLKEGRAGAFVSAGNTGAVMAASAVLLGCIEGVDRPTLAAPLPNPKGFTLLLDVGANVGCKAHHLRQFAVMGSIYAELLGAKNPRVALLSIGEEEMKGNDLIRAVHAVLKQTPVNFTGNIDGKDIFSGCVDVVVCDGFVGNVVLKSSESLAEAMFKGIRQEMEKSWMAMLGGKLIRPAMRAFKRRVDYAEYGGAPLLGVNGMVVICHGRSDARAIRNAVGVAMEGLRRNVTGHIRTDIARLAKMEEAFAGLNGDGSNPGIPAPAARSESPSRGETTA